MPNFFQDLPDAFRAEFDRPDWTLYNDGNRYWWVTDENGEEVSRWECRPFPNCAALVVTTHFTVREGMRNQGIGRALRDLQVRAYKKAGFTGEIATVRTDNQTQSNMMLAMGYKVMDEFGSPFGGTLKLWLKRFDEPAPVIVLPPTPVEEIIYSHQRKS